MPSTLPAWLRLMSRAASAAPNCFADIGLDTSPSLQHVGEVIRQRITVRRYLARRLECRQLDVVPGRRQLAGLHLQLLVPAELALHLVQVGDDAHQTRQGVVAPLAESRVLAAQLGLAALLQGGLVGVHADTPSLKPFMACVSMSR